MEGVSGRPAPARNAGKCWEMLGAAARRGLRGTMNKSIIPSLVSIGAVGIQGQPRPEVSRPVRPQRAVSSLNRLARKPSATLPLASMLVR
jgi:hypothetical protein